MTRNLSQGINCEFQYAQVNNAAARPDASDVRAGNRGFIGRNDGVVFFCFFFPCLPMKRTDVYRKAVASVLTSNKASRSEPHCVVVFNSAVTHSPLTSASWEAACRAKVRQSAYVLFCFFSLHVLSEASDKRWN